MRRAKAIQILIAVLAVSALEAVCRFGWVGKLTLIPPSTMLTALISDASSMPWFWPDVSYTLGNVFIASMLSIVVGFAIGGLIHSIPQVRRVLDPLLSSYYSVPTFVFYPLLVAIFGIGAAPLILMGAMFGVVAMIVSTLTAIDRIPRALVKTARVMQLGSFRTAVFLKLPAAAPHLFTGIRLAVAYSVIGVIAGEFILASAGIGRRIAYAYNDFDSNTMYGMLLFILAFVVLLNTALNNLETRLHRRWYRQ